MPKLLDLKVIRDIKDKKGMFIAITFLVFIGIMLFSSFYMAYLNIKETYEKFYEESNFEDVSVSFSLSPRDVVKEVRKIDGVLCVEGRLKVKGSVEIQDKDVEMYFISLPEKQAINRIYFVEGSSDANSILLLKKFADYHDISVEDRVRVKINGETLNLKVGGLVYSPEFIWIVEEGEYFTTPRTLGIAYVPEKILQKIYGNKINEIKAITFRDSDEVLTRFLDALKEYNVTNYYTGENQPSKKILQLDLDGFRQLAILFPVFFLLISVFAVYVLQTRLVNEQLRNMAVMMALGMTRRELLSHYIKHPVMISIAGGVSGLIAGYLVSVLVTKEYTSTLNLPYYISKIHLEVMFVGFLASLTPVVSGYFAMRGISKIEISTVMRGIIETKKESIIEKYIERFLRAKILVKFSIRNLFRNTKRTLYSIFSVVASMMLIMTSMIFVDSVDFSMDLMFKKSMNYDLDVKLIGYADNEFLKEIKRIKGVESAYPILNTYLLIRKDGETKALGIIGMENQDLYRIFDGKGRIHLMPPEGIILPEMIAKNLSISSGENVNILTQYGVRKAKVYDVVEIILSPYGFADLDELQRILQIEGFNQIILKVEDRQIDRVKNLIESYDNVLRVDSVEGLEEDMKSLMSFFYVFIFFSLLFGGSLGFASIFNTTTINLLERSREIATLRMIGYTARELLVTIAVESFVIGVVGILIGIPMSLLLANLFFKSFESELYYLPPVIYPRTYFISIALVFIILAISLIPASRYIRRMEIDKITKEFVS
jgi:putative ABC transport system permease protein